MILSSTIPITKTQLKLISLLIHSPIAITQDKNKNPVFVAYRQARLKDRNILRVKLLCLIAYSLFLLFNGLWHLQSPRLQTDEKALVALFSFCIPAVPLAVGTLWYQNSADVAILLNMILIYERRVFNTKEKHYNKVLSSAKFLKCALQLLGLCGSMFLQIFVILLIIMKAGRPPFIGSIIPGN